VAALDDVVEAFDETCEEKPDVEKQADAIRQHHGLGRPITELAGTPEGAIVPNLSRLTNRLNNAITRLRRAQARAMRAEGTTTERIADVLGVTRQRVSALLRSDSRPRH
jgi:hypothetical protein